MTMTWSKKKKVPDMISFIRMYLIDNMLVMRLSVVPALQQSGHVELEEPDDGQ